MKTLKDQGLKVEAGCAHLCSLHGASIITFHQ